eukprot:TRINITY_DN114668_c0_g1_i1.p2 TRINITY_DN114668_c0_g1~~TRINITY_DN114668_c0_g1_i1.p2  ORF type:complete len:101 (+),score=15.91 TRINITY_DN114668_c0_g1_i1:417-719(+)
METRQQLPTCLEGSPSVVVRSSDYGAQHLARVLEMIRGWSQDDRLHVEGLVDNSSEWNFEIEVNGVLLHSRNTLGHSFFHDDWCQQSLVWRAVSDLLKLR